jgi:2-methylisocitrate lyase-like PEP mutase family enzyme
MPDSFTVMRPRSQVERGAAFLARHSEPGAFVLPNAWDPGSAKILAAAGFEALGTTSAGIAFAAGLPDDGRIGREAMLDRVAAIAAAVPVPVSADVEAGYADDATGVGETMRAVIAAGAVGANVEDTDPSGTQALFEPTIAAERIRAARRASDESDVPFTLNARVDAFLAGSEDPFAETATRARLYVDAGADCIFVPGISDEADIARAAEAIDAPVNVVAGLSGEPLELAAYERLGVRRVSVGGSLARAAFGLVRRAAVGMLEGRFDHSSDAIPHEELNRLMGDPNSVAPAPPPRDNRLGH